jgi:tRNA nucleotidyltransferase (CCA-adding enzyme)
MKSVYLVGGAVRDMLMSKVPKDLDYVVVNSSHTDMIARGFEQVGADFPVYLSPEGDEYALARREKKTGTGYLGFTSEFGPDVTLEEDLGRRDLTINSIAFQTDGFAGYVDPYNGTDDIKNKILRHTSNAFEEDPVRVLRLARLRARFGPEWTIAPETQVLISKMAKAGVLGELNGERVWKEMSRALMEPYPRLFFDTLLMTDSLHKIFPDIYKLKTALESRRWHPEGDAFEHTMLVLTQSALNNMPLESRLAALTHDFGKGITPRNRLPSHFGHDVNGVALVYAFCNRFCVPAKMRDRAMKACRYHMYMHKLNELNSKTFVKMFDDMGASNDPETVKVLVDVGMCDERGRLGAENCGIEHLNVLYDIFEAYQSVKFAEVFPNGQTDVEKIKDGLFRARIRAVSEVRKE